MAVRLFMSGGQQMFLSVLAAIFQHRVSPCDAYYAIHCDVADLEKTERAYIEKLQPKYNNDGNDTYSVDDHADAIVNAARTIHRKR
jgi:hypothetical protein